jgi:hypothetical protein
MLLFLSCVSRTVPPAPPPVQEPACRLDLDGLDGSEWLFLEARVDGSQGPTPAYRMRFADSEGLTLRYNIGSLSEMYTYHCTERGDALVCLTEAQPRAWCQSLMASGGTCTPEWLREREPGLSDAVIADAIATAQQRADAVRGTPNEQRFRLMHNNLGNKLRLEVHIAVDESRCRLTVTDLYQTLYNGQWITDSNPAGTNPFVANTAGELLWESCEDARSLLAVSQPDATEHQTEHTVGAPLTLRYLPKAPHPTGAGCTHHYTLWHNAQPAGEGTAEVVGGAVDWRVSWTPEVQSSAYAPEALHLHARTTCPGAAEVEALACTAIKVQ